MVLNLSGLIQKHNMKIQGVLHIGAHHGEEDPAYNAANIPNRIYFEPAPENFKRLQEVIQGRHTTHNIALGSVESELPMYVETTNNGASNSLLRPVGHLEQYPWITFDQTIAVPVRRLDSIEFDRSDHNFINMDVQGYELEVLKGAVDTLHSIDYIMTEINRAEVYENCAKITDLCEFLEPYGFKLVEEDWGGGTWGDGLFIKQK